MQAIAVYAIPVYAVLMFVGGLMGFVKGKSKPSLIAGVGSAGFLGGCYALSFSDPKMALGIAFVIALILEAVFAMRLAKTKKFMPAGVLLIMSGIFQVLFILGIV